MFGVLNSLSFAGKQFVSLQTQNKIIKNNNEKEKNYEKFTYVCNKSITNVHDINLMI